jgi:hypothetical protein
LWRRPCPKLGCRAKERRKKKNDQIKDNEMDAAHGKCSVVEEFIQHLVGKLEGNRQLGEHRCRWKVQLKSMLDKYNARKRTGYIGLRKTSSGELL